MPLGINQIDVESIQKYKEQVEKDEKFANVTFKAKGNWVKGTESRIICDEMLAGGQNISPENRRYEVTVDEPPPLGGLNQAPNPAEYIAIGLTGCIIAGIATNAALFDTLVDDISVETSVNFDTRGMLGLDRSVPNNAMSIEYKVTLSGKDHEKLKKAKEVIDRKSPVKTTLEMPIKMITEINLK